VPHPATSPHTLSRYSTLAGIKVVNVETNMVCRVLGRGEQAVRFLGLALFQVVSVEAHDTQGPREDTCSLSLFLSLSLSL